jgi:hypothetical protein
VALLSFLAVCTKQPKEAIEIEMKLSSETENCAFASESNIRFNGIEEKIEESNE